jgi:hydroxyethylthiazole kinase-like uncharacterized protein yjeF
VAEAAIDLVEEGPIVVVAGRGNNGGDGFVAAAELAARGREVSVILLCERDSLKGDAALAARGWKYPVLPFNPQAIGKPALIIDALFGAGLDRPVKGDPLAMIEAINANGAPVLAVDLPSGINGTTGAVMGAAINAVETVTFFRRKPAHLLMPGRKHCGRRYRMMRRAGGNPAAIRERPGVAGAVSGAAIDAINMRAPSGRRANWRHRCARSRRGYAPAPDWDGRLAAKRSRSTPDDGGARRRYSGRIRGVSRRQASNSVVIAGAGVGGGRAISFIPRCRRTKLVLDADALTSFAEAPERLFESIKAGHDPQVVLTPHEGEFPRLFSDISNKYPGRSKLERVRDAAERSGAVVLLKGSDTVIASPDGRASIASNAPPWLATAGAGDVLAGMIAGILAKGVPAYEAACIGVWMHGEGAREAGPGLIAEDLTEVLPAVFRRLYDEFGIEY